MAQNVINLGNAGAQAAYHANIGQGRTRFETNFVKPNVAPNHNELAYACLIGNFVNLTALVVGKYFLLPTTINGPVPTIDNLSQPAGFELAVFKVVDITATHVAVVRISTLENNGSTATASINATATYGPINTRLYYSIPVAAPVVAPALPPAEPRFYVAEAALEFNIQQSDLANAPAALAPIVPPAAPIAPQSQGLVLQQVLQNQAAATRENPTNLAIYRRLQALGNTFSPGQFLNILNLCMQNLPNGQPPSAGYVTLAPLVINMRNQFFRFAAYQVDRTVTVTDAVLAKILLLEFRDINDTCSFLALATPSDLPITYNNIKTFMGRICEYLSPVFGADLAYAIIHAVDKLVDLKGTNLVIGLTAEDCIHLIEHQLYQLDSHFLFTTTVVQNPGMLAPNLAIALHFDHNHPEILRLLNAKILARDAAVAAIPYPAPNPRPNPRVAKRKAGGGQAGGGPTPASTLVTQVNTRATMTKSLKDWRAVLDTANPALLGTDLPCFYSLSNIAPCLNHATCQKLTRKQSHVVSTVVAAHKAKILAWLKTDPLGRF